MINSDRRARMLLSDAMEGGDLAVAELVQNLGAEGAWAKIIEGVLGEPAAQRAAQVSVDVVERLARAAAMRFIGPGDDEWPSGLDDLRHAEGVQRRGGEPVGLWLRAREFAMSRRVGHQNKKWPARSSQLPTGLRSPLVRSEDSSARDYPARVCAAHPHRSARRPTRQAPDAGSRTQPPSNCCACRLAVATHGR
jgi:hypothetical protein